MNLNDKLRNAREEKALGRDMLLFFAVWILGIVIGTLLR